MAQPTVPAPSHGGANSLPRTGPRGYNPRTNTYTLTCGAVRRPVVANFDPKHPYPRTSPRKYVVPILPLPVDEELPPICSDNGTTGCGATVHVSASRGGQQQWTGAGDSAGPTVVLLPDKYFAGHQKRDLGGVPRKEECGCLTVGVGCCVCGNTLGTLRTFCEKHVAKKSCPVVYKFLAAAVSPPLPVRQRIRKHFIPASSSPTAAASTSAPGTDTSVTTIPPSADISAFRDRLSSTLRDWLTTAPAPRPRSPSPTPSEQARRRTEREEEAQALADEARWEDECEASEQAVAAARFRAADEAPTTQEEMRALTRRLLNACGGRGMVLDR
ncbi:hypothetical protein C8R47DRAFT_1152262 [Mycena vitilis]|nr:hypothetical protein C8R47DRAFT_1152262 [Mycena vitilis]